jgi:hypothetical protein
MSLQPGVRRGRYEIPVPLGAGGMVAREPLARFRREARAIAAHPCRAAWYRTW